MENIIQHGYAHLTEMLSRQLHVFPEHRTYMEKRFAGIGHDDLLFADELSREIMAIAGLDLDRVCEDYKWLTGVILEEELVFRRTGHYRLATFEEAWSQIYSNVFYMNRYVNGILASQLWWQNHAAVARYFRNVFIAGNPPGFSHLEIGPGHGLFLYAAASAAHCASAEGWDISAASLGSTRRALERLGQSRPVRLTEIDFRAAPRRRFQSIAFSEVIEHLEDPRAALRTIRELLEPDGRLFLNAPVNSPAPDHIYLFSAPEEVLDMLAETGFVVCDSLLAPCTGSTLKRARRLKLSISTAVIATKSPDERD